MHTNLISTQLMWLHFLFHLELYYWWNLSLHLLYIRGTLMRNKIFCSLIMNVLLKISVWHSYYKKSSSFLICHLFFLFYNLNTNKTWLISLSPASLPSLLKAPDRNLDFSDATVHTFFQCSPEHIYIPLLTTFIFTF